MGGIGSDFRQQSVNYDQPQIGVVVDRKDPGVNGKPLGRVKVRIPGLCDTSTAWALPFGVPGGGSAQRGFKWVPQVGAEVLVIFAGGDPDRPYYSPLNWGVPAGESEVPTDAKDLPPGESEDVHCIEFARYAITVDERPGHEGLVIKDKASGGDSIEFDGTAATGPGILIKASAGLVIQVDGVFSIDAAMIVFNGRKLGVVDGDV
jgi:hypothetical protein